MVARGNVTPSSAPYLFSSKWQSDDQANHTCRKYLGRSPSELSRRLFAQGRLSSLDANQILFLAGDEGDRCYHVEEGLLKASVAAPNGGERILAILGPGSVVGELSMIDGAPHFDFIAALAIPNCALSAKPISTQSRNPARKSTATL